MNAEWHEAHPMPTRPTFEQRLEWHRAHARNCGCRKPPAYITEELERRARDAGDSGDA
jgi:hypothetical protein